MIRGLIFIGGWLWAGVNISLGSTNVLNLFTIKLIIYKINRKK